jgi:hypothetical protein
VVFTPFIRLIQVSFCIVPVEASRKEIIEGIFENSLYRDECMEKGESLEIIVLPLFDEEIKVLEATEILREGFYNLISRVISKTMEGRSQA